MTEHEPEPEAAPVLPRPLTRAWCKGGARPCPYVACEHHLLLHRLTTNDERKSRTGSPFIFNRVITGMTAAEIEADPATALELMPETCVLDLVDRGEVTLRHTAAVLGITRERVRQIQATALRKLRYGEKSRKAVEALRGDEPDMPEPVVEEAMVRELETHEPPVRYTPITGMGIALGMARHMNWPEIDG